MSKSSNLAGPAAVIGTMGALAAVVVYAKGDSKAGTTTKGAPLPGAASNPLPVPSSEAPAKRIPAIAERLQRLWPEAMGDASPMPPAALEIALAQAWLESGIADPVAGGWWKAPMTASGNLGARQCGKGETSGKGFRCERWTDHHADGSPYETGFRFYEDADGRPAADWAALDFLKTIRQFNGYPAILSGDVATYAKALRAGHYFEAPEGDYARAIASHLPAVAAALGHQKIAAIIAPELLAKKAGDWAGTAKAGVKTAGAELESGAANDNAGATLQALHLAGALPRARMLPGEGGSIVWYLEQRPAEAAAAPVGGWGDDLLATVTKAASKIPVFGPAAADLTTGIKESVDEATDHDGRTSKEKREGKAKEAAEIAARKAAETLAHACGPEKARAIELEAKIQEWVAHHPHLAKWTKPDLVAAIQHQEAAAPAPAAKPAEHAEAKPKHRSHAAHTAGAEPIDVTRTDPWRPLLEQRLAEEAAGGRAPEVGGAGLAFGLGTMTGVAAAVAAMEAGRAWSAAMKDTPAITAEPPPAPAQVASARSVIVVKGDSPWIIAEKMGAQGRKRWFDELVAANPQKKLKKGGRGFVQLLEGETLLIPPEWPATTAQAEPDPQKDYRPVGGAEIEGVPEELGGIGTQVAVGVLAAAAGAVVVVGLERVIKPRPSAADVQQLQTVLQEVVKPTGLPVPSLPPPAVVAPVIHAAAAQAAQAVKAVVPAAPRAPSGPRTAPTGLDTPTGMDAVDALAKQAAAAVPVDYSATPWLASLPALTQVQKDQAAWEKQHGVSGAEAWAPLRLRREVEEVAIGEAPNVGGVILTLILMVATAIATALGLTAAAAVATARRILTRLEATGIRPSPPGQDLPQGALELTAPEALAAFAEPGIGVLQREGWKFYRLAAAASVAGVLLGAFAGPMVEGLLLRAIKDGTAEPIKWVQVDAPDLDLRFWAASDAMRAPVDGVATRLGVSYDETIEALQALGAGKLIPATQRLADAVYRAAPIKTAFHSLVTASDPESGGVKMHSVEFARKYSGDVDAQVQAAGGKPGDFQAGADKYWILHPRQVEKVNGQPVAVNYGGWDKGGKPLQPVGGRHDVHHTDYSQNLRPIKRYAEKLSDGSKVDLLDWAESAEAVPARFTEPFRGAAVA